MIHQWEIIQLLSKEHQAILPVPKPLLLRLVELVRELKNRVHLMMSVEDLFVKEQRKESVVGDPILIAGETQFLVFMTMSVVMYMHTLLKVVGV
jgi:hypothetical protein